MIHPILRLYIQIKRTYRMNQPCASSSLQRSSTTVFFKALCSLKKHLNASRPSEHPPVRGKNVKTFRWDHRPQLQNLLLNSVCSSSKINYSGRRCQRQGRRERVQVSLEAVIVHAVDRLHMSTWSAAGFCQVWDSIALLLFL